MNVSRREAIRTGFFAALAGFLLPKIQPYIQELAEMDEPVAVEVNGAMLSYFTRRSLLANYVVQIYNTSPILNSLLANASDDDDFYVNVEHVPSPE